MENENVSNTSSIERGPSLTDEQSILLIGSSLIGINLMLMLMVSFYWLNPTFHNYLSGRPL